MKKLSVFALSLCLGLFAAASAGAGSESYPILSEKDLAPKLASGAATLKRALAVQKKTPESRVEARGEYYSWLSQCIDVIAKKSDSALWDPCLLFAAQLLRIETSGETSSQLVEPYKNHRSKWDETLKKMEDADRLFLKQEAEGAVLMSSEE
jgi:hypothetical protein